MHVAQSWVDVADFWERGGRVPVYFSGVKALDHWCNENFGQKVKIAERDLNDILYVLMPSGSCFVYVKASFSSYREAYLDYMVQCNMLSEKYDLKIFKGKKSLSVKDKKSFSAIHIDHVANRASVNSDSSFILLFPVPGRLNSSFGSFFERKKKVPKGDIYFMSFRHILKLFGQRYPKDDKELYSISNEIVSKISFQDKDISNSFKKSISYWLCILARKRKIRDSGKEISSQMIFNEMVKLHEGDGFYSVRRITFHAG